MIWAYLLIANVAMLAHFGFLAFLIGGGFWAWSRPWLLVPHLVTAGWGFGIETWHWTCPLTEIEQWARRRAGQPGLEPTGFIDTYIKGTMYPAELNPQVLALVAGVVLASWIGLGVRLGLRRRRRRDAPRGA